MKSGKECFIICPIGEEETPTRKRSDQLLRHLYEPVANKCGYETVRADKISKPGIITRQIIERIIESPLVIADLTDHNPNVLYELALRHAIRKPLVQVIQKGQQLPFDIAATRVIYVDYPDPDSMANAKMELEKQIKAVEEDAGNFDNPISTAVDLQGLRQSSNLLERQIEGLLAAFQGLSSEMASISATIERIEDITKNIGYRLPSELFPRTLGKALTSYFDTQEFAHEIAGARLKQKGKDVWTAKAEDKEGEEQK